METPATWHPVPGEPAQDLDSALRLVEETAVLVRRPAASAFDDIPVGVDEHGETVYMPLSKALLGARKSGFYVVLDEVAAAGLADPAHRVGRKRGPFHPDHPDLPGPVDPQEGP